MAAKLGLIESRPPTPKHGLTIKNAIQRFRKHKSRPKIAGGVLPDTFQRYGSILDKFEPLLVTNVKHFEIGVNVSPFQVTRFTESQPCVREHNHDLVIPKGTSEEQKKN